MTSDIIFVNNLCVFLIYTYVIVDVNNVYIISMQTVVYNSPLYYLVLFSMVYSMYIIIKLLWFTIILLLFSSRTNEGVYMTLF